MGHGDVARHGPLSVLGALPPPARALVLVVVVAGAAALAARAADVAAWTGGDVATAGLVTAALVASEALRIDLRLRRVLTEFAVDDAVWAAALLLAEPSVLVVAAAASTALAQAARRVAPVKVAFNAGQTVLAVTVAEVVFIALGSPPATAPAGWLAVAAAMAALWALNTLIMGALTALLERRPMTHTALVPTGALLWTGNVAIGALGALVIETEPLALPLLLVPAAMTFVSYRRWLAAVQERDWMRQMAEDAEAMSGRGDLGARVVQPEGTTGAAVLARTLNALLTRVEAAFRRERRFIRETSHELLTPITIVRGHLEVMDAEPSPLELRETLAVVLDELDRMARIVEDMSTLARMEDPMALRREQVPVERLVIDVAVKATPLLAERLEVAIADGAAATGVRADRQRLTQALINLLTNARDHTPAGTPVVLRVLRCDDGFRFEVADHGGGLAAGEEDRVFEPFHAGARSDGSGLGLAIVAGIARAHGGAAGVDNRPGAGATFWVRVPV